MEIDVVGVEMLLRAMIFLGIMSVSLLVDLERIDLECYHAYMRKDPSL